MSEGARLIWKLKGVFPKSTNSKHEQPKSLPKTNLTNAIFRFHSHFAFIFLILASALVFVQQVLGVHIKCLMPTSEEDLRSSAVTTYCFVTGTYTLQTQSPSPDPLHSHPGVGSHIVGETTQKFHHYFQWVPFILILEGVLFRVPYLLLDSWEGNKLATFLSKVADCSKTAAGYFAWNLGCNKLYAVSFLFAEVLNFLLVLGVFWVTDWFLQGQFQYLGRDYFRYCMANRGIPHGQAKEISPLDKIFPKVSKCDFQKFGPSGQIINYDILCILSLNIIQDKIFLGLWALLIILFLLGVVLFLYRTILIIFPTARAYIILQGSMRKEDHSNIKIILKNIGYGDWFFFKRISDVLDSDEFSDVCKYVAESFHSGRKYFHQGHYLEGDKIPMKILKSGHEFTNGETRRRRKDDNPPTLSADELPDEKPLYNFRAIQEEQNTLKRINVGFSRGVGGGSLTQVTVHSNDEIADNFGRYGKSENVYN